MKWEWERFLLYPLFLNGTIWGVESAIIMFSCTIANSFVCLIFRLFFSFIGRNLYDIKGAIIKLLIVNLQFWFLSPYRFIAISSILLDFGLQIFEGSLWEDKQFFDRYGYCILALSFSWWRFIFLSNFSHSTLNILNGTKLNQSCHLGIHLCCCNL